MGSQKRVQAVAIAWVGSVALHVAIGSVLFWAAWRSPATEKADAPTGTGQKPGEDAGPATAADLPLVGEGIVVDEQPIDPIGDPPRVAAGDTIARLDTSSTGLGGDPSVAAPALNLADRDDRMRLSPDLVSHLDRDQMQRLRVGRVRQSWEDRRSTTHPAELTFVVAGAGTVIERREPSPWEPSRGAPQSYVAAVRGAALGESRSDDVGENARGGAQRGSLDSAPGTGLVHARAGIDHRASAPIGSARPDVTQAAVSVASLDPARPKDNIDSNQEVATTVRALVHASTAGGFSGDGQGGSGAGGEAGAGGANGAGSRARPLGLGEGEVVDWASDPRLLSYYRQIKARISPFWADAFPKSAALDLQQGTVILDFVVFADGHTAVSWPPIRPSGIDEFDRKCADAIRRASPLPPIPRVLGVQSLRIRAPFVESNPIIK